MASGGTSCPLCKNYSSIRKNGKLYVHTGNTGVLVGSGRLTCAASGLTWAEAKELRNRLNNGEHRFDALRAMGKRD